MQTLTVKTERRTQLLDVTVEVQKAVSGAKISKGICYLYVPHTAAGIAINECADPDVARDMEGALDRLIPKTGPYQHCEGKQAARQIRIDRGRGLGRFAGIAAQDGRRIGSQVPVERF